MRAARQFIIKDNVIAQMPDLTIMHIQLLIWMKKGSMILRKGILALINFRKKLKNDEDQRDDCRQRLNNKYFLSGR
jgi:hypothetical protein